MMRKTIVFAALAAFCAGTAYSATYTLKTSVSGQTFDWSAGSNYEGGTAPSAGDVVIIPKDVNAMLADGDEWWDFVSALGRIRPTTATSYFTVSVPAGVTNSLACEITNTGANESDSMNRGGLVKTGGGGLGLTLDKYDYFTAITVNEGGLIVGLTQSKCSIDSLTVAEGAFVDVTGDKTFVVRKFSGAGEITSADGSTLQTFSNPYLECEFGGKLTGNIRLTSCSRVMLTGTGSTTSGHIYTLSEKGTYERGALIGVAKFGNRDDASSSVGTIGAVSLGQSASAPGGFLYLGNGEISDRNIAFRNYAENSFAFIDGGADGGLELTGELSIGNSASAINHRLALSGSNRTDCVFGMLIDDHTDSDGNKVSYHIMKRGSGTWKLNPRAGTSWAGALSVEEGTLKFDTITEAGRFCSLGYATNLFDCYTGVFDESRRVDWAIALGTTNGTEGAIEYTGTAGVTCSTRPIALKGDGRIRQNVQKPFRFDGIFSEGDNAKTLVLDGSGTVGNEISGISDADGGAVSVVKEGTGTWTLSAANSFSGSLAVKEGVLNVCAPNWNWLKFVVRQNFTNSTANCGTSEKGFYLREMAFFNEEGISQTIGTTFDYSSDGLLPGYFTFTDDTYTEQNTTAYPDACWTALFDDSNNPAKIAFSKLKPVENNESSWASIVIRLPEDADPVSSVDYVWALANSKAGCNLQPSWFTVMGSFDGFEWSELFSTNYAYASSHGKWVSSDTTYSDGDLTAARTDAKMRRHGMPLAQPGDSVQGPLDSVECVSVSAGATLKCLYGTITLDSFGVDMTSGGGTVEGFAFAESGTLSVVNVPSETGRLKIASFTPVNCTGVENLSNWTLLVDGEEDTKYTAKVANNGTVRLFSPAMRVIIR